MTKTEAGGGDAEASAASFRTAESEVGFDDIEAVVPSSVERSDDNDKPKDEEAQQLEDLHKEATSKPKSLLNWQSSWLEPLGGSSSEGFRKEHSVTFVVEDKDQKPPSPMSNRSLRYRSAVQKIAGAAATNESITSEQLRQHLQQRQNSFRSSASLHLLTGNDAHWKQERLKLAREMMGELVGSFLLVWFGTGAVFAGIIAGALQGLFQVASVWIIGVTMAIAATASISGAHLNLAISVAFCLVRPVATFGWSKLPFYVLAQLLGAMLASWCLYMTYASQISHFEAQNNITRSSANAVPSARCFGLYYLEPVTTAQAFFAEAMGTAILSALVFALTHPGNDTMKHNVYIPPLIGLTVGGLIGVLAPISGAGFNPARDLGPRIVAYAAGWTTVAFDNWWLYLTAPLVGAPVGAALVDWLAYAWEDHPYTAATSHDE